MIVPLLAAAMLVASWQPAGRHEAMVRCICGSLVHYHELPRKSASARRRYKTQRMGRVQLLLYPRQQEKSCCEGLEASASVQTGRSGKFEFKAVNPGQYWIVVRTNNHDAILPIRYEPIKDGSLLCSDYTWTVSDAGELNLEVTAMLD